VLTDYQGGFAVAGGLAAGYTYDKIWGSFTVDGSYLSGNNAGGPLIGDPATTGPYPGKPSTETPLVWITWTNYVRLLSWLDVFHDLVVDVAGSAGVELRRLDLLASMRAGKHVTIRVGYDHLSAFAIEMWLTRLLTDRNQHLANTVENNLIVDRTARDEARGQIDLTFGNFTLFGEGRFRRRAMVSLTDDPQFVQTGNQVAPGIAYDATLGARDRGSLWKLRPSLWVTYINDYRSRSAIVGLELGRGFVDDRLTINLAFLYANTKDALAGPPPTACTAATLVPLAQGLGSCAGTRDGAEYELGLTLTAQPAAHWFGFFDYRLVADTTNGQLGAIGTGAATAQPTLLTHVLLLRIEARY
jgi:hypothetical protein